MIGIVILAVTSVFWTIVTAYIYNVLAGFTDPVALHITHVTFGLSIGVCIASPMLRREIRSIWDDSYSEEVVSNLTIGWTLLVMMQFIIISFTGCFAVILVHNTNLLPTNMTSHLRTWSFNQVFSILLIVWPIANVILGKRISKSLTKPGQPPG